MEQFYTIKDNYAEILLSKDIYPLVSVKKTLTNFMETSYIKLDSMEDKILVQIAVKEKKEDLENIIGEFYNECLRETLRYNIAMETKNLRELIIGRALYTTCIEVEENQDNVKNSEEKNNIIGDKEYSLDEIAVNWFDKYKNEGK